MKLFDFWTELPLSISSMFSELTPELQKISKILALTSSKVNNAQNQILLTLEGFDISCYEEDQKKVLKERFDALEKEKESLCIQSIKTSVRILNEAVKILEEKKISTELCSTVKLLLKITRLAKEKIEIEASTAFDLSLKEDNEKDEFYKYVSVFFGKIISKLYNISEDIITAVKLGTIDLLQNKRVIEETGREKVPEKETEKSKQSTITSLSITSQKRSVDSLSTTDDDHEPESRSEGSSEGKGRKGEKEFPLFEEGSRTYLEDK